MPKKPTNPKPKPNRTGVPRSIYFDADLNQALVAYRDSQRPKPSFTAIVTLALEEFLKREGFPVAKPTS